MTEFDSKLDASARDDFAIESRAIAKVKFATGLLKSGIFDARAQLYMLHCAQAHL